MNKIVEMRNAIELIINGNKFDDFKMPNRVINSKRQIVDVKKIKAMTLCHCS